MNNTHNYKGYEIVKFCFCGSFFYKIKGEENKRYLRLKDAKAEIDSRG